MVSGKHGISMSENVYRYTILFFFTAILILLLFLSAVCTCMLDGTVNEITFFLPDSALLNFAAVLLVFAVLTALKSSETIRTLQNRMETDEAFYRRIRCGLLIAIFTLSLVWVLSTQYEIGDRNGDQWLVQDQAYLFRLRIFSGLAEDGYLALYPSQIGFVWFSWLFSLLFGNYNALAFQVLNVLALTLFYEELSRICILFGWKRIIALGVLFTGILFFPLILYCSFVYGNLIGLFLAVLAFRLEIQFFRSRKPILTILAAMCSAAAILIKINYMIFWIGLLLYALEECIRQRDGKLLAAPILLILFTFAQSVIPIVLARFVSGEALDQGCSPLAWIAMGLQEGPRAPGWYNRFNYISYVESGFQTAVQEELAKAAIRESLQAFRENKIDAIKFFLRKTESQWCNPTFQSFWNVQIRDSQIVLPGWVLRFTGADGERAAGAFLNLLDFVVLFGSFLWCADAWREKEDPAVCVPAMIFVGGFLFHLIWEAKGQYTISYFPLLFPCAAAGIDRFSDYAVSLLTSVRGNRENRPENQLRSGRKGD